MKKSVITIGLTLLVTGTASAGGLETKCEQVGNGRFSCDTRSLNNNVELVSQTWQSQFGILIEQQGTGYMVARCLSQNSNGQFSFIAALSDGSTASFSKSLACRTGSSTGTPGGSQGCTVATPQQCENQP